MSQLQSLAFAIVLLTSACVGIPEIQKGAAGDFADIAKGECIKACNQAYVAGRDLSAGPCLLDPLPLQSDWVCDVAHSPRGAADNDPQNQCSSYLRGTAKHFVEVTTICDFIRAR